MRVVKGMSSGTDSIYYGQLDIKRKYKYVVRSHAYYTRKTFVTAKGITRQIRETINNHEVPRSSTSRSQHDRKPIKRRSDPEPFGMSASYDKSEAGKDLMVTD